MPLETPTRVQARCTAAKTERAAPETAPPLLWSSRLLVLIAGATALAGQVSWSRLAGAAVGGTFTSSVITLSGAMAGLAIGAWAAGLLLAGRNARKLLLGSLLAGGATLAAMPWLIQLIAGLEGSLALRRVLATFLLGAGHVPFGAILPCVIAWRAVSRDRLAANGGELYALGALGAVVGALSVGEFLAAHMALDHLGLLLALMTVLAAGLIITRRPAAGVAGDAPEPAPRNPIPLKPMGIAFGLGFLGMTTESIWLRVLGFYWESNTLTFAWVTASFVGGLAFGAWGASRLSRRWKPGARGVAGGIGIAALCLAGAAAYASHAVDAFSVWDRVVLSFSLVGLPAVFFGAAFVLLLGCVEGKGTGGRALGFIAGANSLGAAAGPLVLWLASPLISWPVQVLAFTACGYAVLVQAITPLRLRERATAVLLAGAVGLFAWTAIPSAPGVENYRPSTPPAPVPGLNETTLPYMRTGLESTVVVSRNTESGVEVLWIDRGFQGDTSPPGRRIPSILGRLPCELLNRPAERAMAIGLGTGITLSAMVESGCRSVEVAELSRGVIDANRTILADANGRVLERSEVRVVHADGRSVLADASASYDLIVTDMVYPGVLGAGNIFSREFYSLARRRLTPDGVFVHWIPGFLLSPEDFSAVIAGFLEAFPDGTAWIGFIGPRRLILGLAGGAIPRPLPESVSARLALGPSELARLSKGVPPIRDADPRLEYRSSVRRADALFGEENLKILMGPMKTWTPKEEWIEEEIRPRWHRARRAWLLLAEARLEELEAERHPLHSRERRLRRERAGRLYREAVTAGPDLTDAEFFLRTRNYERHLEEAAAASERGNYGAALASLRLAAAYSRDGVGHLHLANALVLQGLFPEAAAEFEKAIAKSPKSSDAHLRQAILACTVRDYAKARSALEAAGRLRPDRPPIFREVERWIRATSPPGRADGYSGWPPRSR